jgi:TRAP-type C4-dicarboxylate transport system permease small subunit
MDLEEGLSAATMPDPGFTYTAGVCGGCMMVFYGFVSMVAGILFVQDGLSCSFDDAAHCINPNKGLASDVFEVVLGALFATFGCAICVSVILRVCCWWSSEIYR